MFKRAAMIVPTLVSSHGLSFFAGKRSVDLSRTNLQLSDKRKDVSGEAFIGFTSLLALGSIAEKWALAGLEMPGNTYAPGQCKLVGALMATHFVVFKLGQSVSISDKLALPEPERIRFI